MGAYSPDQALIFVAAAVLALVVVAALLVRRLQSKNPTPSQKLHDVAASAAPSALAASPVAQARTQIETIAAPPQRVAVPQAAPEAAPRTALPPSYAFVADAQAGPYPKRAPEAEPAPCIDYTGALAGISPNASYAAAAIAAATGAVSEAPRAPQHHTDEKDSPSSDQHNGVYIEPYAAVAAAQMANRPLPATARPEAITIDYSSEATQVSSGASYAAIAVATAAAAAAAARMH